MQQGILENFVILQGVFISSSIVKVNKNSTALTSVLNTTEKTVEINKISLELEPLSHCAFSKISKINSNASERISKLISSIRTSHLNDEEDKSIFSQKSIKRRLTNRYPNY